MCLKRLPSNTSTNIITPDIRNINHESSVVDQTRQELQLNLIRFLNKELDYAGARQQVILPTRQLYADSPHRKPYSDLEFEFRNFNRALDHWESLIKKLTTSSDGTKSSHNDPLEDLAAQGSFKDRVAKLYDSGPRSQVDFPLETWTVLLALFFEGLLGDTYMPCSFENLVIRLRDANEALYDPIAVVAEQSSVERGVE
jgi:hypothetical protein